MQQRGHDQPEAPWQDPPPAQSPTGGPPPAGDPFGASRRVLDARRRRRWWAVSLWVLATVVLALAAVTVGVSIRHSSTRAATGSSVPVASNPGARSSTSTSGAPGTAGGPTITSLTPAQGPAGQTVVIAGSGMVSSDGQVLARFGGIVAPTSCSAANSCTATAPPPPAAGAAQVPVTVSTAGGTSNSLTYTYR